MSQSEVLQRLGYYCALDDSSAVLGRPPFGSTWPSSTHPKAPKSKPMHDPGLWAIVWQWIRSIRSPSVQLLRYPTVPPTTEAE